jgi:cell division protein FtsW
MDIKKLFAGDRAIWYIYLFLFAVSVVEVYSAASASKILVKNDALFMTPIIKHIAMYCAGAVVILITSNIKPSVKKDEATKKLTVSYLNIATPFLIVSIVLLVLTKFVGQNINEANRQMTIFGIPFQPLEFGKLASVIFLASMLSKQNSDNKIQMFRKMLTGIGAVFILILFENYSTAVLILTVSLIMMYIGQAESKRLLITTLTIVLCGSLVITAFITVPTDFASEHLPDRFVTWQSRITSWLNDHDYVINEDNFQAANAKIAIARGSLTGVGPGRSIARYSLPVAYADFIYAIVIEELGLILGGIGVVAIYIILLYRGLYIAKRCETNFSKYLVLGCTLMIVIQALANMAVAVDLLPVTGQPLPMISMGGTSTIITSAYFGIIQSVSRYRAGLDDGNKPETTLSDTTLDEPAPEEVIFATEENENEPV